MNGCLILRIYWAQSFSLVRVFLGFLALFWLSLCLLLNWFLISFVQIVVLDLDDFERRKGGGLRNLFIFMLQVRGGLNNWVVCVEILD